MDYSKQNSTYEDLYMNSSLFLPTDYKSPAFEVGEIVYKCHELGASDVWLAIKIMALVLGFPANIGFFWVMMLTKNALSASEVLSFNLAALTILHSLCLPIDIYSAYYRPSEETLSAAEAISVFNIFSCPLLFASLCLERYLAVAHPAAHAQLGESQYRIGFSALIWALTVVTGMVAYFGGILPLVLPLALVIAVLTLLMLLSLAGMALVLLRQHPPQTPEDDQPSPMTALKSVLAVLAPFAIAYLPYLALDPFLSGAHAKMQQIDGTHCHIFQFLIAFPNFGIYIGPMLNLSRAKQLLCGRKKGQEED